MATICKLHYGTLVIAVAALLLMMFVCPARAEDELVVIGILKGINPKTHTVTVDVKSSSCRGLRTFAVDNLGDLDDFLDQKIRFQIDSSVCKRDTVYKMLPGAGVTK